MANYVKNVALVGTGGHVGRPIVEALVKSGRHSITAITRPQSANPVPTGVDAVKRIDMDDHTQVTEALKGQDVLIITLPVTGKAQTQFDLIDGATAAGVKYIFLNEWGLDLDNKSLAEESGAGSGSWGDIARRHAEKVANSGNRNTHWITLSVGFWYEHSLSMPNAFGFDLQRKEVTLFDNGEQKITVSSYARVGEAVAKLLSLKITPDHANDDSITLSQFANKSVFVSSFDVSQRDMLEAILRVTGDEQSDWAISYENSYERWQRGVDMLKKGDFLRGHMTRLYSRVFFPNGGGDFSAKLDNARLGLLDDDLDQVTKAVCEQLRNEDYQYIPAS